MMSRREMFSKADTDAKFVPVDFTLPEDVYEKIDYGIEALWDALEELLPLSLHGMLQQNTHTRKCLREAHARAAHPHILSNALISNAAATCPVPMVVVPLVMAIRGFDSGPEGSSTLRVTPTRQLCPDGSACVGSSLARRSPFTSSTRSGSRVSAVGNRIDTYRSVLSTLDEF